MGANQGPVLGESRGCRRAAQGNRRVVEAVLYGYRAGIPWRDLPERLGDRKNTHRRFSRWAKDGVWLLPQMAPGLLIADKCDLSRNPGAWSAWRGLNAAS